MGRLLAWFGFNNYEYKVQKQIEEIKSESPEIATMIQELEGSPYTHRILPTTSKPQKAKDWNELEKKIKSQKNVTNPETGKSGNYRQGSVIYYNPDDNITVNGDVRDPKIGLVHEAGHAVDMDRGTIVPRKVKIDGTNVPKSEKIAIDYENTYRKALGVPFRTTYGGIDISPYLKFP